MDRLTLWHRWVGFTLLWTVLTHAVLVVLGYARLSGTSMTKTFFSLAGVPASLLGMCAAAVLVVVAAVSARYVRRRISYETWHGVHLFPNGDVLLNLELEGFPYAGGLVKLDKDSKVLWKVERNIHHAITVLPDGTILVPALNYHAGSLPGLEYLGRQIYEDVVLEISPETVMRDWKLAKAWLFGEVSGAG